MTGFITIKICNWTHYMIILCNDHTVVNAIAEAVMRGEICDSKTALAILMADRMIPASTI